jgi:hypothetical protein
MTNALSDYDLRNLRRSLQKTKSTLGANVSSDVQGNPAQHTLAVESVALTAEAKIKTPT